MARNAAARTSGAAGTVDTSEISDWSSACSRSFGISGCMLTLASLRFSAFTIQSRSAVGSVGRARIWSRVTSRATSRKGCKPTDSSWSPDFAPRYHWWPSAAAVQYSRPDFPAEIFTCQ